MFTAVVLLCVAGLWKASCDYIRGREAKLQREKAFVEYGGLFPGTLFEDDYRDIMELREGVAASNKEQPSPVFTDADVDKPLTAEWDDSLPFGFPLHGIPQTDPALYLKQAQETLGLVYCRLCGLRAEGAPTLLCACEDEQDLTDEILDDAVRLALIRLWKDPVTLEVVQRIRALHVDCVGETDEGVIKLTEAIIDELARALFRREAVLADVLEGKR